MADPLTLAAVGAVGGAALKPSNPLQGALLGATAGFTGGTALGIGGATTAAGAAGGAAAGGAGAAGSAANAAGLSFAGMAPGASAAGINGGIAGGYGIGQASAAPSFMQSIGMAGKSAYENPMMTAQALNATQGLLTPEQMPSPAPVMPLQAGRGVKPYDPMAALNPYQQTVVGGPQVSLI